MMAAPKSLVLRPGTMPQLKNAIRTDLTPPKIELLAAKINPNTAKGLLKPGMHDVFTLDLRTVNEGNIEKHIGTISDMFKAGKIDQKTMNTFNAMYARVVKKTFDSNAAKWPPLVDTRTYPEYKVAGMDSNLMLLGLGAVVVLILLIKG